MNRRHVVVSGFLLAACFATTRANAAVTFGVVSPNLKVRPDDAPKTAASATLKAAKNELEPFQIVFSAAADEAMIGVTVDGALTGPNGATIPSANVSLYREAYYTVGTPSNSEGASGDWPDPLVPDVDTYVGEKRNAFPFTVPAGKSRAVWVEILVPQDAVAGDYQGSVTVTENGASVGSIPIALHVGTFALPSTATLKSVFGMGWGDPCVAHYGSSSCGPGWNEQVGDELRALYVRSALEHRFTIAPIDYQPPFGSSQPLFEASLGKYVNGTGTSRLPGAQVTTMQLDGDDATLSQWITYAKAQSFFDRLFYYPVDEPGSDQGKWSQFEMESTALHTADAAARIIITSSIQDSDAASATESIDIFVPVIDQMENRDGTNYAGNQRSKYDDWQSKNASREVWGYQSCDSHGCGACGDPSTDPAYTGWPQRVIDSSAVQDRAFEWLAFRYDLTGELYFQTTNQLSTAWASNGQCAFSGSGDGTIFYPGTTDQIGGMTGIPVESIRMKMIREGMEDYEYLVQAAAIDMTKAHQIADALFPHSYECAQSPDALEAARDQLFAMLDQPTTQGTGGAAGTGGASTAGGGGSSAAGAATAGTGGTHATSGNGGTTSHAGMAGASGHSSAGASGGAAHGGQGGTSAATGGKGSVAAGGSNAASGASGASSVADVPSAADDSGSSGGCDVVSTPSSRSAFAFFVAAVASILARRRRRV